MQSVSLVVMFTCFALVLGNRGLVSSFGFSHISNFVYLFLFIKLYIPISFVVSFLGMNFNRRAEYIADQFAVDNNHGKALKDSLINQFKRNKGPLVADPLYSTVNHSQPTLIERLNAIDGAMMQGR